MKAREVVIIAAAAMPHLRIYFHLHLLSHPSHFILFCLLISRSLNGDRSACASLIKSPMTAQLQDAIPDRAQASLLRRPIGYQPWLNAQWNLSLTHRQIPITHDHDLSVSTTHLLPSNFAVHAAWWPGSIFFFFSSSSARIFLIVSHSYSVGMMALSLIQEPLRSREKDPPWIAMYSEVTAARVVSDRNFVENPPTSAPSTRTMKPFVADQAPSKIELKVSWESCALV